MVFLKIKKCKQLASYKSHLVLRVASDSPELEYL